MTDGTPDSPLHELARMLRMISGWRVEHGLTAHQAEVLVHLYDAGALTPSRLARLVGITTASMTRIAAGLEREGWIARSRDDRDGRLVLLQPTKRLALAVDSLVQRSHATDHRPRLVADEQREA